MHRSDTITIHLVGSMNEAINDRIKDTGNTRDKEVFWLIREALRHEKILDQMKSTITDLEQQASAAELNPSIYRELEEISQVLQSYDQVKLFMTKWKMKDPKERIKSKTKRG